LHRIVTLSAKVFTHVSITHAGGIENTDNEGNPSEKGGTAGSTFPSRFAKNSGFATNVKPDLKTTRAS
jgi:hypothetical protein